MAAPQQFEFLAESREHLADVCDQLLRLERSEGETARGRVEQMLRAVHSIKGGAGFFGLRTIEQLAHRMENVLEAALERPQQQDGRLIDILLAATDRLAALLDDIDASNSADIAPVLSRLDALLAQPSTDTDAVASAPADTNLATASSAGDELTDELRAAGQRFEISIDLSACHAQGLAPIDVIERAEQLGEIVAGGIESPPVDLEVSDPQHPVVWRAEILSQFDASDFFARLNLPDPGATSTTANQAAPATAEPTTAALVAPPGTSATIRIPVDLVDRLMNLAGELVLVRNQSRRYTDHDQPLPGQVIQRLDAVTSEFQETVLQTRMQPVGNLFNKFPRLVRDLSRQLNKQLELRISGGDVELDKTILDALSDPLTHLMRNACDHGIETPADRVAAGKPAAGTLQLSARHFGDQIWITIEDDGRGIDREAVRRKALTQRLRTAEELARLDDRDLLSLILLPGFSTAAQVTDVSGRGVGMDVVKTNLAKLGGGIDIDSRPGAGTTFTLRLPLTLAIIPTLLVTADGERLAIPQKDLEELVYLDADRQRARIEQTPEGEYVLLRGRLLPLVRLGRVLRAGGGPLQPIPAAAEEPTLFAVVRAGSRRFGLAVDTILTSEEIVVKPLHSQLRRLTVYSGATVLGDGRVALILNTEGLAQASRARFHHESAAAAQSDEPTASEVQSVLLVERINGEPLAIPLALVRRIVMVGHDQIQSISGGAYVTIDGVPTRLVTAPGETVLPADGESLFVVLPRNSTDAVGLLMQAVVGTEQVAVNELRPLPGSESTLGAALIRGRLTPLADLSSWFDSASAERTSDAPQATARVLLVDDTQFFRDVVSRYLTESGHQVVTAEHGAAALELLARENFDIVISDLEMPVMDGWTLAANIRLDPRRQRLPLLSLSTLSGEEAVAKSREHGFNAHEVKLERDSLLQAVQRLLAATGAASERKAAHA